MSQAVKRVVRSLTPPPLYRRYRKARVARIIGSYQPRVVEHSYGGFPLRIMLADPLAEGWYDHDWPEPGEIALLRAHRLRAGAVVFDLGAHQAVVALMFARIVGGTGRVVAVEAEPHNVAVAGRNIALNDAANVSVVWAAAHDEAGELLFSESLNGRVDPGASWGKIRVPAVTVDELADRYGHPDVMLVDVEGWEEHVLRGARDTLRRGCDVCVEVHTGCGLEEAGGAVAEVKAAFPGYRLTAAEADPPDNRLEWRSAETISRRSFLVALAP